jgi:nucleotide-binding universal stress UspA family protein
MRTIVVGVDGSPASLAALRFALGEARLRRTRVLALHAWVLPLTEAPGPFLLELPSRAGPSVQELSADLGRAADARLAAALDEVAEVAEGVEVERRVVEGQAASMLVEASEGADLLVVGSRGHGGFHGLLLGSVSQQCAHHARCPVVIVPSPERVHGRAA